jgi:hypothetical protein
MTRAIDYGRVWSTLRGYYRRRRPVELRTGHPWITVAEALALANRWAQAIEDHAAELAAADTTWLEHWWCGQRHDLFACGCDCPSLREPYDRSHRLWDVSGELAAHLTAALRAAARRRPRNAGTVSVEDGRVRIRGMKDWQAVWIALEAYFGQLRGMHEFTNKLGNRKRHPKTTNGDIRQLIPIWNQAVAKAHKDANISGAVDQWTVLAGNAERITVTADPAALYPQNWTFWKTTKDLAIRIEVAAGQPPDLSFTEALVKNIKNVPDTIAGAVGAVGGAVVDAGGAAVDAAKSAADEVRDLWGDLAKPLLIGAGVLGGGLLAVSLVTRRSS